MKMLYLIVILALAALACGMNAAILPETNATATPFLTVTALPRYTVKAYSLNVRESPSLSARVIYNLPIGAVVEAHGYRTVEGIRWVDIGDGWVAEAWLEEK